MTPQEPGLDKYIAWVVIALVTIIAVGTAIEAWVGGDPDRDLLVQNIKFLVVVIVPGLAVTVWAVWRVCQ